MLGSTGAAATAAAGASAALASVVSSELQAARASSAAQAKSDFMGVRLRFVGRLQRFRASDDLDEFGGDRGLAAAVVLDGQLVDQLAGVARGVVHRGHRRALFRRLILEQRAEQLGL